jgi:hypothetical protein
VYSMSMKVSDRKVRQFVREMKGALGDDNVKHVAGRAGVNVLRDHLFDLDRTRRNSMGGRRSHFFAHAGRATNYSLVTAGVSLNINHAGIALRYFGGTVRPVNSRLLAIPADKSTHGTRPREHNNLVLVMFGDSGIGALMERSHSEISIGKKGVTRGRTVRGRNRAIKFWLVPETEHDPDPTVLPTTGELLDGIREPVHAYIHRIAARKRHAK